MRGRMIMRMMMMFGPMLLRQFQKFKRNKEKQGPQQPQSVPHKDYNRSENVNPRNQDKSYNDKDFV